MVTTMKRLFLLLTLTLTLPLAAQRGTISGPVAFGLRNGSTDPTSCQPWSANIFINRNSTPVLRICTDDSPVTWDTIPTSTSLASTYLKLDASNDPLTGSLLGAAGTTSAVSFGFVGEADTGLFLSAANAIGFVTGGTERWVLNSSGALNPLVANTYDIGGTTTIRDIGIGRQAIFSGSTSGTTTVLATAIAGTTTLTLPAANDTLTGKATTDILTNKSLAFGTNTVTATLAELNTAITDANIARTDTGNAFIGNQTMDDLQLDAGAGSGTYRSSGVICALSAATATTAVTTEEDLFVCTIPANTLNANGRSVRLTAVMRFASTANTKTARIVFGATSRIINPTTIAPLGQDVSFEWVVMRTGASAQVMYPVGAVALNGTTLQAYARDTPAADTTAAITFKITGQNGIAAAGDINLYSAFVEFIP